MESVELVFPVFVSYTDTGAYIVGVVDEGADLYRTIFVNGTMISLLIDPGTGAIVAASDRACKFYGYTYAELTAKTIHEINTLTQDEIQREMAAATRELRNHFVFPHRKSSGEVHHVEVYSSPISINGETLLHSIIFDIEEKIRAEAALEEQRRQLFSILESIPLGIYVADIKTHAVLYANNVLQNLCGRDIVGSTCYRAIHGKSAPCAFCTNPQLQRDGAPYYWEYHNPILDKDFYAMDRLIRWPDGRDVHFEVMVDITERKRNEEKLRRLNATKDKLFSIVSHDLRNPFLNIISLLHILDEDLGSLSTAKLRELFNAIRDSTQNTYVLLENLLDWSLNQLGRIDYNPVPIPLRVVVHNVFDLFRQSSMKKSIQLRNEITEESIAYGDPDMVETILRNLVSNAIKFTESGGFVTARAKREPKMWRIEVHDTGIGMNQDTIDTLFDVSSHTHTSGTHRESGSGLGLLVCSDFVQRHGGSIDVESRPTAGSVFGFTLPVVDASTVT